MDVAIGTWSHADRRHRIAPDESDDLNPRRPFSLYRIAATRSNRLPYSNGRPNSPRNSIGIGTLYTYYYPLLKQLSPFFTTPVE